MSHCRPWRHMLGVETSYHSVLTLTPDAEKWTIQAQVAGWASVLFSTFWRRQYSLAPARKIWSKKRATKVLCVFDLSLGCHTFRPSHLPCFEHPKIVRWWDHIFKFLIRQFLSKNPFVLLFKVKSSIEPSTVIAVVLQKPVPCSRVLCCLVLYHWLGSCLRRIQCSRTPLIRINWDGELSKSHAKKSG